VTPDLTPGVRITKINIRIQIRRYLIARLFHHPDEVEVVVGNLSPFVYSISSDLTQLLIRLPESVKERANERRWGNEMLVVRGLHVDEAAIVAPVVT
jgi:hypothetical protein